MDGPTALRWIETILGVPLMLVARRGSVLAEVHRTSSGIETEILGEVGGVQGGGGACIPRG